MTRDMEKTMTLVEYEGELCSGASMVAGMDEAGRGPLAGPVVAACVVMPSEPIIAGINDSKRIAEKKRQRLFESIVGCAIGYGIGIATVQEIESINMLQATHLAMQRAWAKMALPDCHLLIDAIDPKVVGAVGQRIVKGDALCYSIAAASILAKVARDDIMVQLDETYPQYGFCRHKGYGSKEHVTAIKVHGPCEHHRMSFLGRILHG